MERILATAASLGPLRVLLLLAAFASLVLVQTPGTPPQYQGWEAVPTLIAPVLAPLVVVILLLDSLMAQVFRAGGDPAHRGHFTRVILINLSAAFVVTLVWLPYFLAIFD